MTAERVTIFEDSDEVMFPAVVETETAVAVVDVDPVEVKITDVTNQVTSFISGTPRIFIENDQQNANAAEVLKTIKRLSTHAEDVRKELVKPLNDEVSGINSRFKAITVPLLAFEEQAKAAILAFQRAQAERAKIAREAAEKAKVDREAELRKRQKEQEDEADRLAEEARVKREQAANATGIQRAALTRSALSLESKAQRAENNASEADLLAHAVSAMAAKPAVAPAAKIAGISTVTVYKTAVTDKAAFVRHCLDTGNLHFLEIPTGPLDKMAAATKGQQNWPGITVSTEQAMRAARG